MSDSARLEVYRSRNVLRSQRYRWRLVHENGRVIATSGEGYSDFAEAFRQGKKIVTGHYNPF